MLWFEYIGHKYTNNGVDIGVLHTALNNFTVIDVAVLHIALFELYVACLYILLLCSSDIETNPGPVILKFIYIRKKYRIAQNFDGGKV